MQTNRDLTQSIARASELQIQQGYLDLARQQAEETRRAREESARLQDRVLDEDMGYRASRERVANWRLNRDVMDAFAAGRSAHADFDALLPAMRIIADAFRPEWNRITMTEYVESLYAIAKNAGFAADVRKKLLASRPQ